MLIIGEAVIDDEVAHASFCCDLANCKGACCTLEGGRGAPLEDDEVLEIEKAYPIVKQYLDEKNISAIEESGLVDGSPGDFATTCINDRACVFTYLDGGVAKCSFERAYLNGDLDWRKPISCHLFPLRVRRFGTDAIRYEQISECASGRDRGEASDIKLHDFLREPLIRKFGRQWYESFVLSCKNKMNHH
ncbi:MAG: DUF3109 family protein [Ignavibacteriae bacterium]|nr:DUF3109 family protein [Ignavibacteriota bacterium]